MSNYNSTNTHILATHMQAGDNRRMLLFHICESGRYEFIVGSYFTEVPYSIIRFDGTPPRNGLYEYTWDWGHYFNDVVSAVDYWKNEVIGD